MKYCPYCGAELNGEGSNYCAECGRELAPAPRDGKNREPKKQKRRKDQNATEHDNTTATTTTCCLMTRTHSERAWTKGSSSVSCCSRSW